MTLDERLVEVRPTKRQMRTQELEFYAFFHFSVNTYTNREWGTGSEDPAIFNPEKMNAKQWVAAIQAAGMKGAILTCKHHDGFCLWPSKYTEHSVASSPYKDGKGDIVREVADACKEAGMAFGVYLSPWDMNEQTYGQGKAYDDFFVNQLTELLTQYGPIFAVWFDGACGEGANGKKQVYDWERYYEVIRRLQPEATIHICGPDIRWCGNEAGHTRTSEWSVVPERLTSAERTAENSQQADDTAFREQPIKSVDEDLGSRKLVENETNLTWYPAEVDMSIRPGWFHHTEEDEQVRSLEHLLNVYMNSVGGNSTFLLNIPPTTEGLIHENDVKRLQELGDTLRERFAENYAEKAVLSADSCKGEHTIEAVRNDGYEAYYMTEDGVNHAEITVELPEEKLVSYVVLKENVLLSQRIEKFSILAEVDGEEQEIYSGTIVGYKKIAAVTPVKTKKLKIRVEDARVSVTLAFLGVF